jgi:DNA-3-methyladenine glycosylase II
VPRRKPSRRVAGWLLAAPAALSRPAKDAKEILVSTRTSDLFNHAEAAAALSKADKRLARLIERVGETQLALDECESPYESLLEAIAYQSISGKAAATIYARVKALGSNGACPTPQEILRVRKSVLRKAGLSFAKIAAVRDLAQKTIDGIVPTLAEAQKMSDAELVERLISVRGIGAWTVEMFLIFRLGRPDVLPIHDYGVQKGFALTYRKSAIPKPKELAKFGERWRPYRTLASWYMWRAVHLAGKDARKITKKSGAEKAKKDPPKKMKKGRKTRAGTRRPGRQI